MTSGLKFSGWTMVAMGFLAQNIGVGINFGSYGPLLKTIETDFGVTRAQSSFGLSVMMVAMCLAAPVVGRLIAGWSIRKMMITGALLNAAGHALMTMVDSIFLLYVIYGLLIGPGIAALGIIPGPTLISRWFNKDRGKALGIINMPLMVGVIPLVTTPVLQSHGMSGAYWVNAALYLALVPLVAWLVIDRPEDAGQEPRGGAPAAAAASAAEEVPLSVVLRHGGFWLMCLGVGIITAVGVMVTTHLVGIMTEKGLTPLVAASMLSVYGVTNSIGAILSGWISDRIGPVITYALYAFGLMLPWFALLVVPANPLLCALVVALIALSNGGITTLHAGTVNELFGANMFSRVMGAGYFAKLPFLLVAPWLAGHLYDVQGSYTGAIIAYGASLAVAGLAFLGIRMMGRRG